MSDPMDKIAGLVLSQLLRDLDPKEREEELRWELERHRRLARQYAGTGNWKEKMYADCVEGIEQDLQELLASQESSRPVGSPD